MSHSATTIQSLDSSLRTPAVVRVQYRLIHVYDDHNPRVGRSHEDLFVMTNTEGGVYATHVDHLLKLAGQTKVNAKGSPRT